MDPTNPEDERLQEQHAGRYVAWLGNDVYLSAESYDALIDRLDELPIDQGSLVIGYIEPAGVARVY